MNLLMLYFVVFWLPALLRQTGQPVSAGATAIMLFSVGGVAGAFLEGTFMNRWGGMPVLLADFLCTTLLIAALAYSSSFPLMMAITLVLGFVVQGAQGSFVCGGRHVLPDLREPVDGESAGASASGASGLIVGPASCGGIMLKPSEWSPREIFLAGSIPAL